MKKIWEYLKEKGRPPKDGNNCNTPRYPPFGFSFDNCRTACLLRGSSLLLELNIPGIGGLDVLSKSTHIHDNILTGMTRQKDSGGLSFSKISIRE